MNQPNDTGTQAGSPPAAAAPAPSRTPWDSRNTAARSGAGGNATSPEAPPARFDVAVFDAKGQRVDGLRTDDPAIAMRVFVKQSQSQFGPTHGAGAYVAITDAEGRLDAAKTYEGGAAYSTRFWKEEGRAAYEALVPNPPGFQYPVVGPRRDEAREAAVPTEARAGATIAQASPEADRLTPRDVVVGAAHVAQLTKVGGPAFGAAAQAVGLADAVKVGADVAQGKDVRAVDVAGAAASVTLSAGIGGTSAQAAAQGVAALSAADTTRRAFNSAENGANERLAPLPPLAAIDRRNDSSLLIPRDKATQSEAEYWVGADLASLKQISDPFERHVARNVMGHNAQEQIEYRIALASHDPQSSKEVLSAFREVQQSLVETNRRDARHQELEAHRMAARYAAMTQDAQTVADLPSARIERLASEDFRALAILRDHAAEAGARALAGVSLKNVAYRSAFEREASEASRIAIAQLAVGTRDDAAPSAPARPTVNTIEYVDARRLEAESPDTAALRKRLLEGREAAGSLPATPERPRDAATDTRVAETIGLMTRPELDALADARAPHTAAGVVRAARERIEAEVDRPGLRSSVPSLEDRFNVVRHLTRREYLFRDQPGKVAFTERWLSMQSSVDAPAVVKAMVDRVEERGWGALRVKGSREFERQTWIAATARGIKAVGYEPTALDRVAAGEERERLARERSEVRAPAGGTITRQSARDRETTLPPAPIAFPAEPYRAVNDAAANSAPTLVDPARRPPPPTDAANRPVSAAPIAQRLRLLLEQRGDSATEIQAIVGAASEAVQGKRAFVGRVVDHGADHYQSDPKNERSYFVKLESPDGPRTVWGVDLERAINEAGIERGNTVAIEHRGKQPVTVEAKTYDDAGRAVGTHEVSAMRNTWFVVDVDRLRVQSPARQAEAAQGAGERAATATSAPSPAKPPPPREYKARDTANVLATLELALESKNIAPEQRDVIRDLVTQSLGERKARGQVPKVRVYDPEAPRQAPRPTLPPQRQREALERVR
jgi:Large polyvalent protein-associated domain 7